MARWTPDPTFSPSPRLAMDAPPETLAYVALVEPDQRSRPDALGVIDLEQGSDTYGKIVSTLEMPARRRAAPLRLERLQRRALPLVAAPARRAPLPARARPALVAHAHHRHASPIRARPRSSRRSRPTSSTQPRRLHAAPTPSTAAPTRSTFGARRRERRRTTAAASCCSTATRSTPLGAWEVDRGPQKLAYDFWWHLGHDTLLTSEWGTPPCSSTASCPSSCSAASTATRCTSGISGSAATCRRSTWATSTRWCSSCGRRTTRARRTGSSAWSCRSRTCRPRSGCGTATAASGRSRRSSRSRPSRPTPSCCRRC